MVVRTGLRLCLAGLALWVASCSGQQRGPERVPTFPIKGQVLLNGKPVKGLVATFHPQGGVKFAEGLTPRGVVDDQGNLSVTTFDPADGAPAGEYVITFALYEPARPRLGSGGKERTDLLDGKFKDPATSTHKVAVTDGGANDLGKINLEADMSAYEEKQAEQKAIDDEVQKVIQGQQ